MANTNSTQIAAIVSNTLIPSHDMYGRVRIAYFECTIPTVGIADTMTLCRLPKSARVLSGKIAFSVAQGATATTAIGIVGAIAKYRAAAVTNATTEFTFADTTATKGLLTATEEDIIATNAAAAWTAGTVKGYIEYTVD
ncbi:MAG: hypothetical protein ACRCZI_12985 [Cetobacterium sp.]